MFLPTFLDQSVEHLLAWHVNLSHTNVNLLNTKMLYRKSVRQIYISNVKLFDRLTLILFDRFSGKIFQQIYMCDRFTPWFSVQQICKLAKLSVQICWTNQLMVDAVISSRKIQSAIYTTSTPLKEYLSHIEICEKNVNLSGVKLFPRTASHFRNILLRLMVVKAENIHTPSLI